MNTVFLIKNPYLIQIIKKSVSHFCVYNYVIVYSNASLYNTGKLTMEFNYQISFIILIILVRDVCQDFESGKMVIM